MLFRNSSGHTDSNVLQLADSERYCPYLSDSRRGLQEVSFVSVLDNTGNSSCLPYPEQAYTGLKKLYLVHMPRAAGRLYPDLIPSSGGPFSRFLVSHGFLNSQHSESPSHPLKKKL